MNNTIEIYQTNDNAIEVRFDSDQTSGSVWLNRQQLADLFGRDVKTIGKHVNNVFKEGELLKEATVAKIATVQTEGERSVERQVEHYNLDVIISVGYRVKSLQGTRFRIWATERLKEHLVKGYTVNQQRCEQNAQALKHALELIQKTAQSPELTAEAGSGLVDIVSRYTQTFLWLQQYDEGLLGEPSGQSGGDLPAADIAMLRLNQLKATLIERGEATDLFARPRGDGLASLLGNLDQSVFASLPTPQ